jgi:hypothetical protein
MRIEFANSARGDFHWTQPVLRVGAAADNGLVLPEAQIAPHHLLIHQDARGLVVEVMPDAGRIYVNARPVRERALLREGDTLSVGDCRMLLRSETDIDSRQGVAADDDRRCTVALRAVAGPLSGRVMAVGETLELGPQGQHPLDLPQGESAVLRFAWNEGALLLDGTTIPERYPVRINGVLSRQAPLQPDDQISVGPHRFVVDAPGWAAEPKIVPAEPVAEPLPEEAAGPQGEVWWLILTAAVLALGIALMLLMRF